MLGRRISPGLDGAGEIGHIVVKLNGARCLCGRRSGMEAYAGRGALERRARRRHAKGAETELLKIMKKRDRPRTTSGIWAKALKRDDRLACKLIAKAVEALCAGVAAACAGRRARRPRRSDRCQPALTPRSPSRGVAFQRRTDRFMTRPRPQSRSESAPRGRVTPGCCAYRPSARRH